MRLTFESLAPVLSVNPLIVDPPPTAVLRSGSGAPFFGVLYFATNWPVAIRRSAAGTEARPGLVSTRLQSKSTVFSLIQGRFLPVEVRSFRVAVSLRSKYCEPFFLR